MVNFKKHLGTAKTSRQTDPLSLYETLDRASDKGPLRPAQEAVLSKWHSGHRAEKDLILKMHTGQGKTLIGLLMLQSKLNEMPGPAVYLCPDNFLVDQTRLQARQFGINYCTFDDDVPHELTDGKAILITSVQKLFNGRSKFGLGNNSVSVDYLLMDDCHACVDAVRDAFRLRFDRESPVYKKIIALFDEALAKQGAGTFLDIKNGHSESLLPIPYWDWQERSREVVQILSEAVEIENKKKKDRQEIWFTWPLIKDIVADCNCVIAGHALEIRPHLPPVEVFGSFSKAKNRYFMSATVSNDAFLVKSLKLDPKTILNPLHYEHEKWSGEKMVLLPSLIHQNLSRSEIVNKLGVPDDKRKFGIVALAPSFRSTSDWKACGAKIATRETIRSIVDDLKNGACRETVVIVNRYDGIDLPDRACRVLVLDSMPYSESLIDQHEQDCRSSSEITQIRQARTIEQGFGRSVRGEKDYSVVVVVGDELVKFVRNSKSKMRLSAQTRRQIDIGLEIAKMAEDDLAKEQDPMKLFVGLVNQCLKRDEDWKAYYVQEMDSVDNNPIHQQALQIFMLEREAEVQSAIGEHDQARKTLQKLIDTYFSNDQDRFWYLQEMARLSYKSSVTESNRLQVFAHRGNRYLLKPRTGVEFKQLDLVNEVRVTAIKNVLSEYSDYEQLSLHIDEILSNLQFGVKAEKFEEAVKQLGLLLGFASERPDKEWKEGPDNLWCLESGKYLLIECKNEVNLERAEIYKDETGQMNNACAWFNRHYKGTAVTRIIVIPTNRLANAAGFVEEVGVMRERELSQFRNKIRSLFSEFRTLELKSVSDAKVQSLLESHSLSVEDICTLYAKPTRR